MVWKNYRGFTLEMGWTLWDVMGLSRGAGREGLAEQGTHHQQGHRGELGWFVEDTGVRPPGEVDVS